MGWVCVIDERCSRCVSMTHRGYTQRKCWRLHTTKPSSVSVSFLRLQCSPWSSSRSRTAGRNLRPWKGIQRKSSHWGLSTGESTETFWEFFSFWTDQRVEVEAFFLPQRHGSKTDAWRRCSAVKYLWRCTILKWKREENKKLFLAVGRVRFVCDMFSISMQTLVWLKFHRFSFIAND